MTKSLYMSMKFLKQGFYILLMARKMTQFIPSTLVGWAADTSIPTTFVGMVIPTKLLGTVYFDKSCEKQLAKK